MKRRPYSRLFIVVVDDAPGVVRGLSATAIAATVAATVAATIAAAVATAIAAAVTAITAISTGAGICHGSKQVVVSTRWRVRQAGSAHRISLGSTIRAHCTDVRK